MSEPPDRSSSGRTQVPGNGVDYPHPAPPAAPQTARPTVPPAAPQTVPPAVPPAAPPLRRRTLLLLSAVVLLVLALGTAGLVVIRPGLVGDWLGDDSADSATPAGPPEPAPSPVLVAAGANAPMPTPDGVRAAIDPLVGAAALGSRVNVSVADLATGEILYSRGPDAPTVPASVTKLVTGAAVLATRGPAYRIPTRAVAGAEPGEVVLVGGGDPTLAAGERGFYPGAARLDKLAEQVKAALGGTIPTKVTVDGTLYSGPTIEPGWDADIPTGGYGGPVTALMIDGARVDPRAQPGWAPRSRTPDLAAGVAFARALGLPATAVGRGRAPAAPAGGGSTPTTGAAGVTPGVELGRVQSPPIARLVDIMLGQSDNLVAEALARQVALARNQPASFTGAAAATRAVLTDLGLPAEESNLVDGSGLSRDNRLTPSLLTDLFVLADDDRHPELSGLFTGLPVAGWSGTLKDRYGDAPTAGGLGVVRAKTGTLTGVHAIAGVLTTAEGRPLTFAIMADRAPGGSAQTHPALDRIAATLAGCGCR